MELDLPPQVDPAAQPGRDDDRVILVRPDGYIGWVGFATALPGWAGGYFRPVPLRHVASAG